jgi:anthranilate synthase component 1
MKSFQVKTIVKEVLADDLTPVAVYQTLRDHFAVSGIMESNDMRSVENCYSFVLAEPIAGCQMRGTDFTCVYPDGTKDVAQIKSPEDLFVRFNDYMKLYDQSSSAANRNFQGVFGYSNFETCRYYDAFAFPRLDIQQVNGQPELRFDLYRYVLAFNHLTDRLYICCNVVQGEDEAQIARAFEKLNSLILSRRVPKYPFKMREEETADCSADAFMAMVDAGRRHCLRGDVFQIVLSRAFQQRYEGDDFKVYRALRSINPSPYLFYFNYEQFRLFGSSPESQLIIQDRKATIHPIAGTYKRTGRDLEDAKLAQQLLDDPKENAEHVMLVDLARNDVGRQAEHVEVSSYKEIKYYSHVIHLVSQVDGILPPDYNPLKVFGATFPAGTLSGAPKIKAVELIGKYEKTKRGSYGGAIGFIGFNGDVNTAIIIRSFKSENYTLHYRAGAGVVIDSVPANELAEVDNKIAALRKAIQMAEKI